jgi:hypothetical protein
MNPTDEIDSVFSIYENPPTKRETYSKIYLDLLLLESQISAFIDARDTTDDSESQSTLLTNSISFRQQIQTHLQSLASQPARGN